MWWHDKCTDRSAFSARGSAGHGGVAPASAALAHGRMVRAAAALAIAALAGGCFQPLYGEQSPTGGPVLRDQLSAVEVLQIPAPKGTDESRIAVEIRNALIYDFAGGGYPTPPTPRPETATAPTRAAIIRDRNTPR